MINGEVVGGVLVLFIGVLFLCLIFHRYGGKKMDKEPIFEVFNDKKGEIRFRLKAPNGEIICQSESYKSKQACMDTLGVLPGYASKAKIIDLTK